MKMEKKYQVFVSSTYPELIEERAAVTQCLLEIGCIPVGMEQFPTSNMSQMEYIKKMMDDCDYYILILAGKYGYLNPDGISYTEKEYDYAVEKGIPVMSFLIKDTGKLVYEKCENTDEKRKKLNAFREKVCGNKLIKYYEDCGTLQKEVAVSVQKCIRDYPARGWVRGGSEDVPDIVDQRIENYMKEHTSSNDDIDQFFKKTTSEPQGNASSDLNGEKTISLAGARTMLEKFEEIAPRLEWEEF